MVASARVGCNPVEAEVYAGAYDYTVLLHTAMQEDVNYNNDKSY